MFRGQRDILNGSLAAKQLRSLEVNIDAVKRISKIKGFTLAEVLITLAIIGVVAALTMPVLIQHIDERKTVNQLAKTYSVISQAWQRMEAEYDSIDTWGLTKTDTGNKDNEGNTITDPTAQNLVIERLSKYLNVASQNEGYNGKILYQLDGTEWTPLGKYDPYIVLSDGTYLGFGWYDSSIQKIAINVILPTKKDITLGKNAFYFTAYPHKVLPEGLPNDMSFDTYCSPTSTKTRGRGCAAWVLQYKNMDYLHCRDKLSWNGKHSCK